MGRYIMLLLFMASGIVAMDTELEGLDGINEGLIPNSDKANAVLECLYGTQDGREKEYEVLSDYFKKHRGSGNEILKSYRFNAAKGVEAAKILLDALMVANDAKEESQRHAQECGEQRDRAENKTFVSTLIAVGSGAAALASTLYGLLEVLSADGAVVEVVCNCSV